VEEAEPYIIAAVNEEAGHMVTRAIEGLYHELAEEDGEARSCYDTAQGLLHHYQTILAQRDNPDGIANNGGIIFLPYFPSNKLSDCAFIIPFGDKQMRNVTRSHY
jgi:hypothetical protein